MQFAVGFVFFALLSGMLLLNHFSPTLNSLNDEPNLASDSALYHLLRFHKAASTYIQLNPHETTFALPFSLIKNYGHPALVTSYLYDDFFSFYTCADKVMLAATSCYTAGPPYTVAKLNPDALHYIITLRPPETFNLPDVMNSVHHLFARGRFPLLLGTIKLVGLGPAVFLDSFAETEADVELPTFLTMYYPSLTDGYLVMADKFTYAEMSALLDQVDWCTVYGPSAYMVFGDVCCMGGGGYNCCEEFICRINCVECGYVP